MRVSEYAVMFVLVAIMGAGIPGPGDASLIAAGALAGEGKLNIWIVLATAGVAWMLGSVIGFVIGARGGRPLLDHPGRLEKRRRKLLTKGDRAFGRYTFVASATLPAFVSGIFQVRFWLFLLGALTAGIFWIGTPTSAPATTRLASISAASSATTSGRSRRSASTSPSPRPTKPPIPP